MSKPESYFEITTQMGCRVACLNYCPQEKILENYKGDRVMTFEMFKQFMETIPDGLPIFFSGLSEPFQNQECIDMIEWCHANGHPITIFSTLTGLNPDHARRLIKIPITKLVLHLPDAYHNAKIPTGTWGYRESLMIVLNGVENVEFMNMGGLFKSHLCEGMARHNTPVRKTGRRTCIFLETPGYQLSPNGDVCFCCMVRGIAEKVGNLYEETYPELAAKHPAMSYRMATDPNSICHICTVGEMYWLKRLVYLKEQILGGRTIMQVLSGGYLAEDNKNQ